MRTTRYRLCDDPPPRASGAECKGEAEQVQACQRSCPVDGEWTEWSDWSDCFCDDVAVGSGGVRAKIRVCEGVANGGTMCKGPYLRYAMCRNKCGSIIDESVSGTMTEWSNWTECFCDGIGTGSSGARTRSRTCEGTSNAGDFCSGEVEQVDNCDGDCNPAY